MDREYTPRSADVRQHRLAADRNDGMRFARPPTDGPRPPPQGPAQLSPAQHLSLLFMAIRSANSRVRKAVLTACGSPEAMLRMLVRHSRILELWQASSSSPC